MPMPMNHSKELRNASEILFTIGKETTDKQVKVLMGIAQNLVAEASRRTAARPRAHAR